MARDTNRIPGSAAGAGVLAALCLLDVGVAEAAGGFAADWPAVVGPLVGILAAGVAVLLGYRIQRRLDSLERPVRGSAAGEPAAAEHAAEPVHLTGVLAKLDSAERLNARQFGLQRSQFELFKRMRGDLDPATLARAILEYAGEYYGAPVGVFYLARPDRSLEPTATYGLAAGSQPAGAIPAGEGIVGRVAQQRDIAVLDDVLDSHLDMATGIGRYPPRSVIVAPFHFAGQVMGALELGVAGPVKNEDLDFLRSSSESVAMALDSALARARVQRLLKETRRQAAALADQRRELQVKNAELERADRYKTEFLTNMSHELRTPLNSMLIMSQVLAENREANLTGEQVETALTINKAGNELLLIINDILDMSRVEAGRLETHPERTDLAQILRGVEDLFRPVARRQDLELRLACESDLASVVVTDPLRVSQILKNLLSNAFKFTTRGAVELRLRSVRAEEAEGLVGELTDWVAIDVSDTGIGMTRETARHVFGVFQQGDGSIARRYGGSGLGLAISLSLAELLGGTIGVDSAEGRGSTFTLLLPREPAVAPSSCRTPCGDAPAAAPERARPDAGDEDGGDTLLPGSCEGLLVGWRVLLVDADMRTVYELSSLLDGMGAEVAVARSGDAALDKLDDGASWSLLVVDSGLLSGHDRLAARIVAQGLRTAVLADDGTTPDAAPGAMRVVKPVGAIAFVELCRSLACSPSPAGRTSEHRQEGVPQP